MIPVPTETYYISNKINYSLKTIPIKSKFCFTWLPKASFFLSLLFLSFLFLFHSLPFLSHHSVIDKNINLEIFSTIPLSPPLMLAVLMEKLNSFYLFLFFVIVGTIILPLSVSFLEVYLFHYTYHISTKKLKISFQQKHFFVWWVILSSPFLSFALFFVLFLFTHNSHLYYSLHLLSSILISSYHHNNNLYI